MLLNKMKYIRYTFIAALICCFALSIKGIIAPEITFTTSSGTELSGLDVDPQMYANSMTKYRTAIIPWLGLIGLILCGWIFLSRKKVVYGTVIASVGLLGYIIFNNVWGLGYTLGQSVSVALQGHGTQTAAWTWFYLAALVTLLIATMKNAEGAAPNP